VSPGSIAKTRDSEDIRRRKANRITAYLIAVGVKVMIKY
jgi:hypothetical protein